MSLTIREGFSETNIFKKTLFFEKSDSEKSSEIFEKKPKFSRKTIHKNPRGWLSSFLALITNLYSELLFTLLIMEIGSIRSESCFVYVYVVICVCSVDLRHT